MSLIFQYRAKTVSPCFMQRGVGLLEVLITVLVLSVGLLGLAGMQMASVKQNTSASLRSQAVMLVYDMADRVKANKVGSANTAAYYVLAIGSSAPTVNSSDPSGEQRADQDLIDWLGLVSASLPGGDGSISFTADNEQMIVTVCWTDIRIASETVVDSAASTANCGVSGSMFFQFSTDV